MRRLQKYKKPHLLERLPTILLRDATYNLPFVKNGLGRAPLAIAVFRTVFNDVMVYSRRYGGVQTCAPAMQ
jgi:hypothetical protein